MVNKSTLNKLMKQLLRNNLMRLALNQIGQKIVKDLTKKARVGNSREINNRIRLMFSLTFPTISYKEIG